MLRTRLGSGAFPFPSPPVADVCVFGAANDLNSRVCYGSVRIVSAGNAGLKATVIDNALRIHTEIGVNFDRDFPQYGTRGGALFGPQGEASSPVPMFLEAMDMLLSRLQTTGPPMGLIAAISASGQQHGSVYWSTGAAARLGKLDPSRTLTEQLAESFSVENSPIWMDASTKQFCDQIERTVGGSESLAEITGSKAFRRFTAPQIAKVIATKPEQYANTERICLISAFVATLFLQTYAPEDVSDAAGTNLLEIRSDPPKWSSHVAGSIADDLSTKLSPAPVQSYALLGRIGPFFQQRYGFSELCEVVASAGDNPCSAAGMLLQEDKDMCVSLGTSDTAFMLSSSATPSPAIGSVYRNPLRSLSFLPLVVYTNGSLTREAIRDYGDRSRSWEEFESAMTETPRANNGVIGFHFTRPEIVPETNAAVQIHFDKSNRKMDEDHVDFNTRVRASVEMRAMAIKLHTSRLGMHQAERIIVTGGGAKSPGTLRVLADVLNCPTYVSSAQNSAGLGAAFRAYHALRCSAEETGYIPFIDAVRDKIDVNEDLTLAAEPDPSAQPLYNALYDRYIALEAQVGSLAM